MNLCGGGGVGQSAKSSMVAPSSGASWKSGDAVPDQFPAGLRVLIADDDSNCLKILKKMLMNCLYEEAVPKKILELMNVHGLTRENVASHLQKYWLYLRRLSGVSPHPNGHSFMGPQDPPFGSMPSLGALDLQVFATTGQIPAQSLASLQALGRPTNKSHISMSVPDQRNLFSFDNPKLRLGEVQQQLHSNSI